jgi:hypothetical protein
MLCFHTVLYVITVFTSVRIARGERLEASDQHTGQAN